MRSGSWLPSLTVFLHAFDVFISIVAAVRNSWSCLPDSASSRATLSPTATVPVLNAVRIVLAKRLKLRSTFLVYRVDRAFLSCIYGRTFPMHHRRQPCLSQLTNGSLLARTCALYKFCAHSCLLTSIWSLLPKLRCSSCLPKQTCPSRLLHKCVAPSSTAKVVARTSPDRAISGSCPNHRADHSFLFSECDCLCWSALRRQCLPSLLCENHACFLSREQS